MNIMDFAWHDDQFLFRLTSTFGWEEAVVICDELVTGIENASLPSSASIPNQDGTVHISSSPSIFNDALRFSQSTKCESLDDWIKLAKSQLMHQDQWGNTPLHVRTFMMTPVSICIHKTHDILIKLTTYSYCEFRLHYMSIHRYM